MKTIENWNDERNEKNGNLKTTVEMRAAERPEAPKEPETPEAPAAPAPLEVGPLSVQDLADYYLPDLEPAALRARRLITLLGFDTWLSRTLERQGIRLSNYLRTPLPLIAVLTIIRRMDTTRREVLKLDFRDLR